MPNLTIKKKAAKLATFKYFENFKDIKEYWEYPQDNLKIIFYKVSDILILTAKYGRSDSSVKRLFLFFWLSTI
jgi:hypothetical protein